MSKVRLYGSTSGYIELAAPAVADDGTLTLPTAAGGFVPGDAGIGSNVVNVVKSDTFTTASTSFTPLTGLSLSFTPTSAASSVLLIVQVSGRGPTSGASTQRAGFRLMRDATPIGVNTTVGGTLMTGQLGIRDIGSGGNQMNASASVLDAPATTSAITYSVEVITVGGANLYINQEDGALAKTVSTLTAIEVAA